KSSDAAKLERVLLNRFDVALGRPTPFLPRAPLFSQVSRSGQRTRVSASPIEHQRIESGLLTSPYWFPTDELIRGERCDLKDCCHAYGITHIHHFYLPRQLVTYSCLWDIADQCTEYDTRRSLRFFLQSNALGMTVLNRFGPTHY